jgi:collagenase-like PrtC family protease
VTSVELLAPAKDLECGIAAINCGADAVYIGAPRFGAREAAGNSMSDIAALAAYAHKYWAKVYVTVNTLLHDDEIPEALRLITDLYDIGIDGLIIQDTGLLECDLPPLPIIASTQMHNNTPEKVEFLEKVGLHRVILARELSLDQIREIRKRTNIELEVFVHGALCVSYSGQCYLSYALGGRSGNRGQCAQPCRKPYDLADSQGNILARNKHLLSLKDLNLSEHLRELLEIGVSSFKIEGRLKDKTYVANVVAFYRDKLDRILADMGKKRSSSGTSVIDFTPDPQKTFNRGYTTYFLHGWSEPVGSIDTPKMVGEAVGKVTTIGKRDIKLDLITQIHRGDGICFFDRNGVLGGSVVNDVQGSVIILDKPDGIEKGLILYRNHDHEFLTSLAKSKAYRQVRVSFTLRESPDGLVLSAKDEDGNKAEFSYQCEKTTAEKPDQAVDNIKKQLSKTGGTHFTCSDVKIELSQAYFLPICVLNTLRRGVLESLEAVREQNRPKPIGKIEKNDFPYPEKQLTYLGNVLNHKAEEFYRRHGVTAIEPAAESGLDLTGRKVMTTRYCIKYQLGMCPQDSAANKCSEPLFLIDRQDGRRLRLHFNCRECQMEIFLASTPYAQVKKKVAQHSRRRI